MNTTKVVLSFDAGPHLQGVWEAEPGYTPSKWSGDYVVEVPTDLWETFRAVEKQYEGLLARIEEFK